MGKHEISGDWVVPTQTQMKELVDVIGELPLPIIDRLLREPAVRSLNFDMHYPSGGRNVCSLQIVDSPIDGDKIAFDEGTQSAVYLRLFTVEGRAAELEFTAYLWLDFDTSVFHGFYCDAVHDASQCRKDSTPQRVSKGTKAC